MTISQNTDLFNQSFSAPSLSSSPSNAPSSSLVSMISFDYLVTGLNLGLLSISIVTSLFFVAKFFFFYRIFGDRQTDREKQGLTSLNQALWIWLRYLPFLLVLYLYSLNFNSMLDLPIFAVLVLTLLFKVYFDLLAFLQLTDFYKPYQSLKKGLIGTLKPKPKAKK